MARPAAHRLNSRGYALIAALLLVLTMSLAAMVAVQVQRLRAQREREAQLLFVGDQYRRALQSYFALAPSSATHSYPQRLGDLLEDGRFLVPVRHLRQLYPDPISGKNDWILVRQGEQIVGLHSRSADVPLRRAGFAPEYSRFASARTYEDWVFSANEVPLASSGAADQASSSVPISSAGTTGTGQDGPMGAPSQASTPTQNLNPVQDLKTTCFGQYILPSWDCNNDPPPMGTNPASCLMYYRSQYQACLAGAAQSQ